MDNKNSFRTPIFARVFISLVAKTLFQFGVIMDRKRISSSFFLLLITLCHLHQVSCRVTAADDAKYLVLSKAEKQALDELKRRVLHRIPEDFMKTDFYLIRWVRKADLNVPEAEKLLMGTVKWRVENKMSSILENADDFSDLSQEFRLSKVPSRDKEGHPFGTIDFGDWPVRDALIQGRIQKLRRYLNYALELGMQELLRTQRESPRPIVKGLLILDGSGSNARQHMCPQCVSVMVNWIQTYERHYPDFFWEVIIINAPPIIAIALRMVRPVLSEQSQKQLKIFDTNKAVWMKYLDERIDRSQRTPKYGGTKKEDWE